METEIYTIVQYENSAKFGQRLNSAILTFEVNFRSRPPYRTFHFLYLMYLINLFLVHFTENRKTFDN